MGDVLYFETIGQYNEFNKNETLHPLVSVVDLSKAAPRKLRRLSYNFYTVFLKEIKCGDLRYGCSKYDYEKGTLIFLAPGQAIGSNEDNIYQPQGLALVFHSDLIHGTSLGRTINNYTFFSYAVNEALHLSERERQIIIDCFQKIQFELEHAVDKHSKKLIVSNIELFLNYCERFYDRQFITRDVPHRGFLEKFEALLNDFFSSEKPQTVGLPSVSYFSEKLNLSSNYFGDLVKKDTGKSAHEFIQLKLIDVAKERIFDSKKSVSEIAYELGFKYPQHFSRVFKQYTGMTPKEYKNSYSIN
jgi:AraC-like DNA-binding protein